MRASWIIRRSLTWTAAILGALIVLAAGLLAAVDAGYGRGLLIQGFALRTGREIRVNGPLQAHLFSRNPQVIAEQVTIGNPPWMPAGLTAEVGRLTMLLKLPWFDHPGGLVRLDMEGATLHLVRDADGRANWQMTDPAHKRVHKNSPIIRSLSVPNAHVELADDRRHLQFVGTVSASGPDDPGAPQPVRIVGAGQLNGRAATFEVTADPLTTASHKNPYHFTFSEHSRDSHIAGRGVLPQPFAFEILDADFETAGPDLKDLYFLTGVHLLDTGTYHLTGKLSRRGTHTEFNDLQVTSGQSDMRGNVSVDSANRHRKIDLDLSSRLLKLSDLGLRAAGRAPGPKSPLLLSDARISLNLLRIGTVTAKFRADEVDVGRVPLHDVAARATIDDGVLTVTPLGAEILGGRANGHLTLDGRKDVPAAAVDFRVTDLQLGQLPHKDTDHPAIEGPVRVRVVINGAGQSIHQVAATANGTVTAQLRSGEIRESFAELTGLDLRGLGLLLVKNKNETPVRCAIASFKAHDGTLSVQNLVADTDPILITGGGQIHLDSEALDLALHGDPKSTRLFRLRTPVLVQGTLAHPAIHIQHGDSKLVVVDPGNARDTDCSALLDGGQPPTRR
jgi:AsmA family protein